MVAGLINAMSYIGHVTVLECASCHILPSSANGPSGIWWRLRRWRRVGVCTESERVFCHILPVLSYSTKFCHILLSSANGAGGIRWRSGRWGQVGVCKVSRGSPMTAMMELIELCDEEW